MTEDFLDYAELTDGTRSIAAHDECSAIDEGPLKK